MTKADLTPPPSAARLLRDIPAATRRPLPPRAVDAAVLGGYLALACVVLGGLWLDLDRGYLVNSMRDQHMWEWFFAVTARAVADGTIPLWSDLQNHPTGVNLMANTAMFGIGIPLAPLTLAFGPTVTFAVALTAGLAGTAAGWYWVLSRHIVRSRAAAAVGGAFAGFAPAIVSHANAHPNFVALFALPLVVRMLIRLTRGERPVRDGALLGLLVTWQIFIGEEPLLIAATTMVVFAAAYALIRPEQARPMVRPLVTGIGIGAAVTLPLVAYPLWVQFFGPASYDALSHALPGNDVLAFVGFAGDSLAGGAADPVTGAAPFAANPTEENAYFGLPLVALLVVLAVRLWREPVARACAVTVAVLAAFSWGDTLSINGVDTGIPGPWMLLGQAPLFESVVVSRFAMGCIAPIAVLLALGVERALADRASEPRWFLPAGIALLAAALLPLLPTPLHTVRAAATPSFFAEDTWRGYVEHGGAVVPVPVPDPLDASPLAWQVDAGLEFPVPEGYFVGPGEDGVHGRYGAVPRPTSSLLAEVARSGVRADVDDADRAFAAQDLRFWRADVVVLGAHPEADALRGTVEDLLGIPARRVADVWVWNVRPDGG